jgi:replicative DNA helicase
MAKNESINLGYLGYSFQIKLVKQLVEDHKFSESIISIVDPNYFDNEYMRLIVASLKDYYEKYETIPSYETIFNLIKTQVRREIARESAVELIKEVKESDNKDCLHTQDVAIKFCKQQELKKATQKIQKILDNGDFDRYEECEELVKQAITVGTEKDEGVDMFHAIEDVLSDDFRNPIPTGLVGIDNLMGGGLSKGELGVILAAFGVGKTTIMTRMANTAYLDGKNVVQIFFEDNVKVIQRKHLTCFTGIDLNELGDRREEVQEIIPRFQNQEGNLILKKMSSDGTTVPHIKQYLRKLISSGIKPDIVFLDYIDCVQPTKQFKDEFSGEGNVMRQFETMLSELDIAGWTAVQGNRSAIGADLVEANMMGGSIKKGQIGHFILSVAKTLDQKEEGRATLAVLKSRFGRDGVVFTDIVFDNGTLNIDTSESTDVTLLQHEKGQKRKDSDFIASTIQNKRNIPMTNN